MTQDQQEILRGVRKPASICACEATKAVQTRLDESEVETHARPQTPQAETVSPQPAFERLTSAEVCLPSCTPPDAEVVTAASPDLEPTFLKHFQIPSPLLYHRRSREILRSSSMDGVGLDLAETFALACGRDQPSTNLLSCKDNRDTSHSEVATSAVPRHEEISISAALSFMGDTLKRCIAPVYVCDSLRLHHQVPPTTDGLQSRSAMLRCSDAATTSGPYPILTITNIHTAPPFPPSWPRFAQSHRLGGVATSPLHSDQTHVLVLPKLPDAMRAGDAVARSIPSQNRNLPFGGAMTELNQCKVTPLASPVLWGTTCPTCERQLGQPPSTNDTVRLVKGAMVAEEYRCSRGPLPTVGSYFDLRPQGRTYFSTTAAHQPYISAHTPANQYATQHLNGPRASAHQPKHHDTLKPNFADTAQQVAAHKQIETLVDLVVNEMHLDDRIDTKEVRTNVRSATAPYDWLEDNEGPWDDGMFNGSPTIADDWICASVLAAGTASQGITARDDDDEGYATASEVESIVEVGLGDASSVQEWTNLAWQTEPESDGECVDFCGATFEA